MREEAGTQVSNHHNSHSTSQGSKCLSEGHCKLSNFLCGISTRQLELLLGRTSLTAQHSQDGPIFFIQLSYVHKLKQNKVLPPYVNSLATRWQLGFHFLLIKNHIRQTLRGRYWAVWPAFQSNSSNCLVLIPQRQLGNYLLTTVESFGLTSQHLQDCL